MPSGGRRRAAYRERRLPTAPYHLVRGTRRGWRVGARVRLCSRLAPRVRLGVPTDVRRRATHGGAGRGSRPLVGVSGMRPWSSPSQGWGRSTGATGAHAREHWAGAYARRVRAALTACRRRAGPHRAAAGPRSRPCPGGAARWGGESAPSRIAGTSGASGGGHRGPRWWPIGSRRGGIARRWPGRSPWGFIVRPAGSRSRPGPRHSWVVGAGRVITRRKSRGEKTAVLRPDLRLLLQAPCRRYPLPYPGLCIAFVRRKAYNVGVREKSERSR
jgi:hypothetical protein